MKYLIKVIIRENWYTIEFDETVIKSDLNREEILNQIMFRIKKDYKLGLCKKSYG